MTSFNCFLIGEREEDFVGEMRQGTTVGAPKEAVPDALGTTSPTECDDTVAPVVNIECANYTAAAADNTDCPKSSRFVKRTNAGTSCIICSKSFTAYSNALNHVKAVHIKSKMYKCSYCEKAFTIKCNMKLHENKCKMK